MVTYCTVCRNNNRKNKDISYFTYPKEGVRRLEWLKAVSREDLVDKIVDYRTRQHHRICEEHFEKRCIKYSKKRTVKYLHDDAFPTLNLPLVDDASTSKMGTEITPKIEIKIEPNTDYISSSSIGNETDVSCGKTSSGIQVNTSARTAPELSADTLRKINRIDQPQESKKVKLYVLNGISKEHYLKLGDKFFGKGMSQIIKWQIDVKQKNGENQYSEDFKIFALNLYYSGPAAYGFLSNIIYLPPLKTLQSLVTPISTKFDKRLHRTLKMKVNKMGPQEKICSICVDCMPLKSYLYYNITNDRIIGLHEINGIQKPELAKYVIVLMIRGIIHNWKQPIAYSFLSQCKNYPEVNAWIDEVVTSLLEIGLDIRTFVSDLDSDVISASKSHSVTCDKTYFVVNGHKIYYIFNVPHLIKCVRDNLKTCDFVFEDKTAKWSHITKLYEEDIKRQNRLASRLTDIHVNPNKLQKKNVKLAAQVLSRTVSSAIKSYVDLNAIDITAKDTADFVNIMNDLFDVLNSSTLHSPNKFKRVFCGDNYQIQFLQEMLKLFGNLQLLKIGTNVNVTSTMKFIKCFQISIKSLLQLYKDLQTVGIKFIYTRRLNKDITKKFFAKVKQTSNGHQKPTCQKFYVAFKKMFICNILKKLEGTVSNDGCHNSIDTYLQVLSDHITINTALKVGAYDYRFDLPKENGIVYISVYLYKKCMEQHQCEKLIEQTENKHFNSNSVQSSLIPPVYFVTFVELLDKKFREYFDCQINLVNVGNEILKRLQDCEFDKPCDCFPIEYLKKLFLRFRIYHTVKLNNKLLKNGNYKSSLFRVDIL